jgi:isoleucyl-tRNA synthetase
MKAVSTNVSFPKLEEEILEFWKNSEIFQKSTNKFAGDGLAAEDVSSNARPSYVFYDGPPFATGLPHYGHLLAGTIKDVIGRFFTMKGYHVDRRFGWDCHGVPVEFEIQKSLNLGGAKDIREFGIANFNEACRSIVERYSKEWERFVERSGRWVDFDRQFKTMDKNFMESVWWAFKTLWDKGLIYESFKNVSYSPSMSTPLSNFEANLNYKNVQDPAVTVKALVDLSTAPATIKSIVGDLPISVCIWTTTPWTLPSNTAIAVNKDITYAIVKLSEPEECVILSENLVASVFPELSPKSKVNSGRSPEIVSSLLGSELIGVSYKPFFDFFEVERDRGAFRIFHGDFVSDTDGTGLVHLASFGEDDLGLFLKNSLPIIDPIDEDGCFDNTVGELSGLYFKDADSKIIAFLKEKGLLLSHSTIEHSYPFCWRTDKPLMYKSISTWFINVEKIKEGLLTSNEQIRWVPEHVKHGRFGKWLENARDWAVSRNRFWGTPIPVFKTESGRVVCIGSVAELEAMCGKSITDIHMHQIDGLELKCPETGEKLTRVPEVLDCWFESGAMPYAQAHYPFENREEFESTFPADFIAEGLDQTRGWFYTLIVLSTALFDKPAFKNVIVNGIILAEDGRKMSKSLKNYPPADEVLNKYGADALRMYLLSSAATKADELRFSEVAVKDVLRQTLIPLWNAYNFFVTYAVIDKWDVSQVPEKPSSNLLDRWILSRLTTIAKSVDQVLSSYQLYLAAPSILKFIDELTNWYIRLNRRRFWQGATQEEKNDKFHAYATLHSVLSIFSRVISPIMPFISESIFMNLASDDPNITRESVHLTPFPSVDELKKYTTDFALEEAMSLFEEIIILGRALRSEHDIKLRQPLSNLTIVLGDEKSIAGLRVLDEYIKDELNIKQINYQSDETPYVSLSARLNTIKLGKTLGPKLGKEGMPKLNKMIAGLTTDDIRSLESGKNIEFLGESFSSDDILISRKPKDGLTTAASAGRITIILDTALTPELRLEGLSREFINRVQKLRKESDFDIADRIIIRFFTGSPHISMAVSEHKNYIMQETLAVEIEEITDANSFEQISAQGQVESQDIDGVPVLFSLQRIQS